MRKHSPSSPLGIAWGAAGWLLFPEPSSMVLKSMVREILVKAKYLVLFWGKDFHSNV
jgi:hypothetical protein